MKAQEKLSIVSYNNHKTGRTCVTQEMTPKACENILKPNAMALTIATLTVRGLMDNMKRRGVV